MPQFQDSISTYDPKIIYSSEKIWVCYVFLRSLAFEKYIKRLNQYVS